MCGRKLLTASLLPTHKARPDLDSGKELVIRELILQARWLWRNEDGKDMVEYGLLLVLLSLAGLTALMALAKALKLIGGSNATSQSTS